MANVVVEVRFLPSPFIMGQGAPAVTFDALDGKYPGGFVETPKMIVDSTNVLRILWNADKLYPKPSKGY